jgi:hypothetical protein
MAIVMVGAARGTTEGGISRDSGERLNAKRPDLPSAALLARACG